MPAASRRERAYRVVHRVKLWSAGAALVLEQQIIEGNPPLATRIVQNDRTG
jgi:hypothetical protein